MKQKNTIQEEKVSAKELKEHRETLERMKKRKEGISWKELREKLR